MKSKIRFIFSNETTTSPFKATAPPLKPVRPPEGTIAKDYQVKPLGLTVKATDAYGECSFDGTVRGCSADLFDAAGKFLATIILPASGHLEVKINMPEPVKG